MIKVKELIRLSVGKLSNGLKPETVLDQLKDETQEDSPEHLSELHFASSNWIDNYSDISRGMAFNILEDIEHYLK